MSNASCQSAAKADTIALIVSVEITGLPEPDKLEFPNSNKVPD
jgi:hypothetical protein